MKLSKDGSLVLRTGEVKEASYISVCTVHQQLARIVASVSDRHACSLICLMSKCTLAEILELLTAANFPTVILDPATRHVFAPLPATTC